MSKAKRVRCKATGRTGKLRYYYTNDVGKKIAVINPDKEEDLLKNDEILPENLETIGVSK